MHYLNHGDIILEAESLQEDSLHVSGRVPRPSLRNDAEEDIFQGILQTGDGWKQAADQPALGISLCQDALKGPSKLVSVRKIAL